MIAPPGRRANDANHMTPVTGPACRGMAIAPDPRRIDPENENGPENSGPLFQGQ